MSQHHQHHAGALIPTAMPAGKPPCAQPHNRDHARYPNRDTKPPQTDANPVLHTKKRGVTLDPFHPIGEAAIEIAVLDHRSATQSP
jgi:hypothetical protein